MSPAEPARTGPGGPCYSFVDHARWSGAQWLRGYDALSGSVRATLSLIELTGARGSLHADGVGFEKLAAEEPAVLSALREALAAGRLELVGGTYGHPVGLFHGGESAVRQRVFGVRVVRRLLGTTPRVALEAQFGFFPQLPQVLAGCGFRGAALVYMDAWSTPAVPVEDRPLVTWEGFDGTRLPALARTRDCLGPWPEELEAWREREAAREVRAADGARAVLQWLELGDTPGWPSSAEGLAPALRALLAGPELEVITGTASELIAALAAEGEPPVRAYGLDDVFHGTSLGKNGDYIPRYSRMAEEQLLAAEGAATLASLFGRPYASWDVYPVWELEEAWRDLLVGQGNEVHEREGLVGAVGERSFERSLGLSGVVLQRSLEHLAGRVDALEGASLVFNPLGWTRDVAHQDGVVRDVPPFGYRAVDPYELEESPLGRIELYRGDDVVELVRGDFAVTIDRARGVVRQIRSGTHPEGILDPERPLADFQMLRGGALERFDTVGFTSDTVEEDEYAEFVFLREGRGGSRVRVTYSLSPLMDALWVRFQAEELARPDGGVGAGLATAIEPRFQAFELVHDHPYGISTVRADRDRERVHPAGPWSRGELVREQLRSPFTSLSLVDLLATDGAGGGDGSGLLVVHDGSQAWRRTERGAEVVLSLHDPWDGEHWDSAFEAEFFFAPHGPLSDTDRAMISMELNLGSPRFEDHAVVRGRDGQGQPADAGAPIPPVFGALEVDADNVIATALYRESRRAAAHVPGHFATAVRDPLVVRLVEFDGRSAEVVLRVPGPLAKAARTTLLGEIREELAPTPCAAPFGPRELPWSALRLKLAPHEVATVMIDAELARQAPMERAAQRGLWVPAPGGRRA